MDRRRLRGILLQGVLAPIVTLALAVGGAVVVGVGVGITVLIVSMVAAAGLTAVLLADTRGMQPETDGVEGSPDTRSPIGVRNELTDTPDVPAGNRRVATRYTAGLFLLAVGLVLYLGGLFG